MEKYDISAVIDKLVIIPDTNILLFLYKCSFNTSQNIVDLLNKVKDMIIIPNRVYREYLEHKDNEQAKIDRKYDTFTKDLKNQVDELKGKISGSISESRKYYFPDCDALEIGINNYLDKTISAIRAYENSLSSEKQNKSAQIANVEQLIQFWSNRNKILMEPDILQIMEYAKEGEFRYRYKMPPGYMDEEKDKETKKDSKSDNFESRIRKYGDLFVWKEIINIGKRADKEQKLIFLTNDVKEDWWELKGEPKNREAVRMRDELLREYITAVGNENIEFMTLPKFYELFSEYYEICDIKTALELDIDSYIRGEIYPKYQNEIEKYIDRALVDVSLEELNPLYFDIQKPSFEIDNIDITEINLHFDDEGETAIYDVTIEAETFTEHIIQADEDNSWIADIVLGITVFVQIHRDLRNLDEDSIKFNAFFINLLSDKDAWEAYLEMENDAKAEADDALEDYYNH